MIFSAELLRQNPNTFAAVVDLKQWSITGDVRRAKIGQASSRQVDC